MSINWAGIRNTALHAGIIFATTLAVTLYGAAPRIHDFSTGKSIALSAVASAAVTALHYLAGHIPATVPAGRRRGAPGEVPTPPQ